MNVKTVNDREATAERLLRSSLDHSTMLPIQELYSIGCCS